VQEEVHSALREKREQSFEEAVEAVEANSKSEL
jgi:hypothetical protein